METPPDDMTISARDMPSRNLDSKASGLIRHVTQMEIITAFHTGLIYFQLY